MEREEDGVALLPGFETELLRRGSRKPLTQRQNDVRNGAVELLT